MLFSKRNAFNNILIVAPMSLIELLLNVSFHLHDGPIQ